MLYLDAVSPEERESSLFPAGSFIVKKESIMAYSNEIATQIEAFLEQKGIHCSKNTAPDENCIFTIKFKINSKVQSVTLIIIVRDNNFSILATIPISADEDHRLAAAEFLTRANFNMRIGNFELNMLDGEIRFKTYSQVPDPTVPLPEKFIGNAIFLPLNMIERYADGLLAVLFDFKTPKEAIDEIRMLSQ